MTGRKAPWAARAEAPWAARAARAEAPDAATLRDLTPLISSYRRDGSVRFANPGRQY